MTKNKINFCEYSGDDCTWCQKRIFDNDKNLFKTHSHIEIDNTLLKDENGNIKILEMFHKKCIKQKRKQRIKEIKYNEKNNKFTCTKCIITS
ncbi:hypothetical protein [Spiroplasma endosymbiont of Nebria brevicollis]|uniref:hypothetical protein n=1 Tax=Spiroplasma endosymbiont of Nebria brevicollis TaxID=3066284 RepID=UPI00313CC10A